MKTHGKTSEEAEDRTASKTLKVGAIVAWLVAKILVDNIMIVLPEEIQDNGYYLAQSAWIFVLLLLFMNYCNNLLFTITILAITIYQAIDMFTEVYILLGLMNLTNAGLFMHLGTLLCVVLLITILLSKFYDGKASINK